MKADRNSILALVTVQTLFGLHYLAAKVLLRAIEPEPWALIRAGTSGIILLAFVLITRRTIPKNPRLLAQLAAMGLFGVAINQYLFVAGLKRTTPGHSALINTAMPVLVVLFAVLLGRERVTVSRLAGIGLTLIGVLVLVAPAQITWSSESMVGDIITFCNAVSYAFFLVVGKPILERVGTVVGTTLVLAFGGLWLVPVGLPGLLRLDPASLGTRDLLLGAFIILGPTIGAYGLNTYALRRLDSSLVAFFIYLQPLIGATLSIALGLERATLRLFVAAAIMFAGLMIALRIPIRKAAPAIAPES